MNKIKVEQRYVTTHGKEFRSLAEARYAQVAGDLIQLLVSKCGLSWLRDNGDEDVAGVLISHSDKFIQILTEYKEAAK